MKTIDARFAVRESRPGLGQGLFARQPFKRGDFVVEYAGVRITTAYADTLKSRYLFEIDEEWTIDGSATDNIARYINHSCEPNCEAEIQNDCVFIRALRSIEKGEELTIDYGEEYFDEFIRPFGCKCGRCREAA